MPDPVTSGSVAPDSAAPGFAVAASAVSTLTTPADPPARKSRLGLLRHRDFRQLFLADGGSQIGAQIGMLALPLVAAVALRATPLQMGLVAAGETVPLVIATLPAGALADRMRRRPLMIACDLGRAATLAVIPIAWWLHALTIWHVIAVAFTLGLFTAVFDVAYQSLLPDLVGGDDVVEGNSKLSSLAAVSQITGPAIGGFLIRAITAPYATGVNALAYLSSACWLSRIRHVEPKPERRPGTSFGRDIAEGLRYVARHPLLRAIALETATINFFNAISNSLLLYFWARELHLSSGVIGTLLSVASLGGLAGALLAARVGARVGTARVIWLVPAVIAPLWFTLPMMRRGPSLYLVAAAFTIVIAGGVIFNVTAVSFRQRLAPQHLLGRVNATMRFLVLGLTPLAALLAGALGDTIGVRATLWVAATGCALSFLPTLFSPLRTLRDMPTAPAAAEAPNPPGVQPTSS